MLFSKFGFELNNYKIMWEIIEEKSIEDNSYFSLFKFKIPKQFYKKEFQRNSKKKNYTSIFSWFHKSILSEYSKYTCNSRP